MAVCKYQILTIFTLINAIISMNPRDTDVSPSECNRHCDKIFIETFI